MALAMILSLLILAVVVYFSARILGSVLKGLLLIGLIFLASFLIIGSMPNPREIPIIGRWLPDSNSPGVPKTTGGFIRVLRNVFFNLDIIDHSRASSGNLLIIVANTGSMELSNLSVFVDGEAVDIVNNPKDPLKSGESTVIEVGWENGFETIFVKTKETTANYSFG